MPSVIIEVCRHYTQAEEKALIEAVHTAMMDTLKIPKTDKTIRLIVHEPHRFGAPPGKTDKYTLVEIDLFSGRSLDAKKALYQAIVRNFTEFGIPADQIMILLRESPAENWGIKGGIPASEVDLGFKVDI